MATLVYNGEAIEFDDRVLAHVQIIVVQKLRHREAFPMTWKASPGSTHGRSCVWLNPAVSLEFHFTSKVMPVINRRWLEELAVSANSARGLMISDEPVVAEEVETPPRRETLVGERRGSLAGAGARR